MDGSSSSHLAGVDQGDNNDSMMLPITCAWLPRDSWCKKKMLSCAKCDKYRDQVQSKPLFLRKSPQQSMKNYACTKPMVTVKVSLSDLSLEYLAQLATDHILVPGTNASEATMVHPNKKRCSKPISYYADNYVDFTAMTSSDDDSCVAEIAQQSNKGQCPPANSHATTSVTPTTGGSRVSPDPEAPRDAMTGDQATPQQLVTLGNFQLRVKANGSHVSPDTPDSAQTPDTPNQIAEPRHLELQPRDGVPIIFNRRVHIPSQNNLVNTSNHVFWNQTVGKAFDKQVKIAVQTEQEKRKSEGTQASRRIDTISLSSMQKQMMKSVYPSRQGKTRAKALVESLFQMAEEDPELFEGAIMKQSSKYLRKKVYKAWKYQRTMDLCATGGLNYEACNMLRAGVEELPKSSRDGVIPHGSTIANSARLLERHAERDYNLGITVKETEFGPSSSFDLDSLLRLILTGFGLEEYAKEGSEHEPVLLAHTLDGAQLTAELGHVTAGIKIVDPRAVDPKTGFPICLDSNRIQSRELCFPFQIVFGKDNKDLYNTCFGDAFEYFNREVLRIPDIAGLPALSNFKIVAPQDMASIWKSTGLGGGCHNKKQFCYACMCKNSEMAVFKEGDDRCERCLLYSVDQCFCHPVNDSDHLETTEALVKKYAEFAVDHSYEKLNAIQKTTKLKINPLQSDRESHPHHIDFQPNSDKDAKAFNILLMKELKLRIQDKTERRIALMCNLENKRKSLKKLIAEEEKVKLAIETIERQESVRRVASKLLLDEAVPCILHLEMRIAEKLFWSLATQGLDRYLEDREGSQKRKLLIKEFTHCMQHYILGSTTEDKNQPRPWVFPLKKGNKQVEPKNMTNNHSRRCIKGIKQLASLVFGEELDEPTKDATAAAATRAKNADLLQQWHDIMDVYSPMMTLITKHEDYTADEIGELHILTSKFMFKYVKLFQGKGITNYIHMVGAGHLSYYISKFGNLYRFSQQGWEAMNQKLKHFYFNNTNHGGSKGNSHGSMIRGDHVMPLMRMCQRTVMWRLGLGDAYFLELDGATNVAVGGEPIAEEEVMGMEDATNDAVVVVTEPVAEEEDMGMGLEITEEDDDQYGYL